MRLGSLRSPLALVLLGAVLASGSATAAPFGRSAEDRAARDAFQLKCPNCFCKVDSRIRKHGASLRQYGT